MGNRFYLTTIAALVVVILSLMTCNSCQRATIAEMKAKGPDTIPAGIVVRVDTAYLHDTTTSTAYVPKPYAVIKRRVDSFIQFEGADTMAILERYTATLQDYFSKVYYKDSSLTKYGTVYISDTVQKNRIAGRSITTNFTIPVITNTITNTVEAKKRNQVFFGLNAQGGSADYLSAFGPSLMLKTKGDQAFEVGALYNKSNAWLFQAGIKFCIKLKK